LLTLRSAADFYDAENAEFFYAKMPFSFGAGMCYITGAPLLLGAPQRTFAATQHDCMRALRQSDVMLSL
jgi:hypothetical protein